MTPDQKSIDKLAKRPIQYWFEDGIGELVTGGLLALIGIYFTLQAMVTHPGWRAAISILSVIIIGSGVIVGRLLIAKLKEQLVYPRTGYVSYPRRPSRGKLAVTIGSVITVALLVIILGRSDSTIDWTPFVSGAICGALLLFQAYQTGLTRLYLEAGLAVLIGGVVAFSSISGMFSSGVFFLVYGLVMVFAGGCAYRQYLKNAPPINQQEV
jgi:hypothetical protein